MKSTGLTAPPVLRRFSSRVDEGRVGFETRECPMAETVHLFMKANGTAIDGQSTQTSLGREKSIECIYFEHVVNAARETASGIATGRRTYDPILIRKRI